MNRRTIGVLLLLPVLGAIEPRRRTSPRPWGLMAEDSADAGCKIIPQTPLLAFDLHLRAGYTVEFPRASLTPGQPLYALFRVAPLGQPDAAVVYEEALPVAREARLLHDKVQIDGFFEIGQGEYEVEWAMEDDVQRLCSGHWRIAGDLPPADRDIALRLNGPKAGAGAKNIAVLVNFAPRSPSGAALQPDEVQAIIDVLSDMERDPAVGHISLIAFSLYQRKVIFQRPFAPKIDFDGLRQALDRLKLGTVSYRDLLSPPLVAEDFIANLIREEAAQNDADVVILLGSKAHSAENSRRNREPQATVPVFGLFYTPKITSLSSHDPMSRAVKRFRGTAFSISRPHDFAHAWQEITASFDVN